MAEGDYVVMHTVPVYVYVRNHGEIYAVHVDDEHLSPVRGVIRDTTTEQGFERGSEQVPTDDELKHYEAAKRVSDWPAWQFGW